MREFILLCLVATSRAASVGYNYQPAGQNAAVGSGFGSSLLSSGTGNGVANGLSAGDLGYNYQPGGQNAAVGSGFGSSLLSSGTGNGVANGLSAGSLGYNYQPGGQNAALGSGFASSAINSGTGFGVRNGLSSENSGNNGVGHRIDSGFGGFTGSHDATTSVNNLNVNPATYPSPHSSEYNKEFFSYTAPEEEFHDNSATQRLLSTLKKNLRVVFIKAPENQGLTNAALQLAKQATEDRTAIYVLNKQNDLSDLVHKLQSFKSGSANKPEVHFVKYRTAQDAVRAQQAIQAQYDGFGGPSALANESVAPVLNFVSDTQAETGAAPVVSRNASVSKPKHNYLPASLKA